MCPTSNPSESLEAEKPQFRVKKHPHVSASKARLSGWPQEVISGHQISLQTLPPLLNTHLWLLPFRDRFLPKYPSLITASGLLSHKPQDIFVDI